MMPLLYAANSNIALVRFIAAATSAVDPMPTAKLDYPVHH